jgi:hypothetical protein
MMDMENDRGWGLYKIGFVQGPQKLNNGTKENDTRRNDRVRFHCMFRTDIFSIPQLMGLSQRVHELEIFCTIDG